MSVDPRRTVPARWAIPAAMVDAILARRSAVAPCDAAAIAGHFLPFAGNFAGFLEAARAGVGDVRRAAVRDARVRFDRVEGEAVAQTTPRPGEWYLMKDLAGNEPRIAANYRALCSALGKDDQADVTAYAHGDGVHAARHTDLSGGLIVGLVGEREWRLEPPLQRGEGIFEPLRDRPWGGGFNSAIEPIATGPDTALYIPGGWWHEVRSLGPSLTLRIGIAERTVARSRAEG